MPAQSTTKPLEFEGRGCQPWSVIHPGARASRPHPYSCKQPPICGRSPCNARQTCLCGVLFHRASFCAGETPALPGGLCAGETPALPGGLPARILIPANSLPSTATPLQSAPSPPLQGSLPSCQFLCGRDARAPRWSFGERMAIGYAYGRNDRQVDPLAGGRIRARWRSWHATGCCRSPKCCRAPVCVRKTLFLQTASRLP